MNSFHMILYITSIVIASFSQIILKKGANQKNIYINKYTVIGYTLMVLSTIFSLLGFEGLTLSMSQLLQSLSFIFVAIFSYFLLKEKINKRKFAGLLLIVLGIVVYTL